METVTREVVARMIDHAFLAPTLTPADVRVGCESMKAFHVMSVCVRPCDVSLAAETLEGSDVLVGTVIGFPHGSVASAIKAAEARQAMDEGAAEIDMVANVGRVLGGDWAYVEADIAGVVRACHERNRICKVIFETCYLSNEQKVALCGVCASVGADFAKTSTGFGTGGATVEDVRLMRESLPPSVQVKASGGVRTWADALAMREAGATRLGTSQTAAILGGGEASGAY